MTYPANPATIIIKNKYYPAGLKEIDIWDYYQSVKTSLLSETINRNLMVAIMTDVNKPILRRKFDQGGVIRLTPDNYDKIITGRSATIYSEVGPYETFGIIDIDIDPNDGFAWARKTTLDVYNFVMDKIPIVRKAQIKFTGKTSFHIVCEFSRKMKVDTIRFLLQKFLRESELSRVYTIEAKRRPGVPNLDLSPNKTKGAYITLHSLSLLGLKCMEVPYNRLMSFNPNLARIK